MPLLMAQKSFRHSASSSSSSSSVKEHSSKINAKRIIEDEDRKSLTPSNNTKKLNNYIEKKGEGGVRCGEKRQKIAPPAHDREVNCSTENVEDGELSD